jgi:multiple sugar transport system substrate-binding protein
MKKFFIISAVILLLCTASLFLIASKKTDEPAEEEPAAMEMEEFDWRRYEGTEIGVLMDKHPYADRIVAELQEFEDLTGISVTMDQAPEAEYHDKLLLSLSSKSPEFDAAMTGIMDVWSFAPAGYLMPLDDLLADPSMTNPDYDWDDIFPKITAASRWDLVDGHKAGTGDQWAVPIGFEQMALIYRTDLFEKYGIAVPKTLPDVLEAAKIIQANEPDMYGFSHRGNRFWGTCHTGPITMITNYGATDFYENLQPAMGTPDGIAFHKDFIRLMREAGPKGWTNYDWYDVLGDLANGTAAMAVDADILGFFAEEQEGSVCKGKIGWAPPPTKPGGDKHMANLWIWNLSINANTDAKEAAWLFIQWATGPEQIEKAAIEYVYMNPIRESAWENEQFKAKLAGHGNYRETFLKDVPNSALLFTPQADFAERVTEWAAALQKMYEGADVEETLAELVESLTL